MNADPVALVLDVLAIRELTARYNRAFDDNDVEAWIALFTPDGVLEMDGRGTEGREALRAMAERTGYGVVHMTTDATVTVYGDRAVQECTLLLARRTADRSSNTFRGTGRYRDELVRTPEGWRFARRSSVMDTPPAA